MDYQYVAYNEQKELVKGTISGASEAAVLISQGYHPLTIKQKVGLPPIEEAFPSLFKIKPKEIIMFSRQLATLLDAGISIVPALHLLQEQAPKRQFRNIIGEIGNDLRSGSSFSEALFKHEKVFGQLYCNLIAAGERIGGLDQLLRQAADYIEKDMVNKAKIKKALTYPVIVLGVAAAVITVLLVFVLPEMVDMFDSVGQDLPITTRILINVNDFFQSYGFPFFVGVGVAMVLLIGYVKRPAGRYRLDRFLLKTPVVGTALLMSEMARFSRILVLMIRAGLPLPEIVAMTRQTSTNVIIKDSLANVRTGLLQGEGLSEPMSRDPVFPNLLVQMVMVGEESGRLETTLETVADNYERTADEAITNMISMIEPVMTIVLALIVGFIAVSVITPMYEMTDAFK